MDEADWDTAGAPIISDELVQHISALLKVTAPDRITHLGNRLRRYARAYHHACKRARYQKTAGETRDEMASLQVRVSKLRLDLPRLCFVDKVATGYVRARKMAQRGAQPSLERLDSELAALETVAKEIAEAPPHRTGQRGRLILRHYVGAIMALFEAVSSTRPRLVEYRDVKGIFLDDRAGAALLAFFKVVAPGHSEARLARLVDKLDANHRDRRMIEGEFDLISKLEDDGELIVQFSRH